MVGTLELSNLVNIHSSARKLLKFLLALPIKGYGKEQEKYITVFKNFHSSCIRKQFVRAIELVEFPCRDHVI